MPIELSVLESAIGLIKRCRIRRPTDDIIYLTNKDMKGSRKSNYITGKKGVGMVAEGEKIDGLYSCCPSEFSVIRGKITRLV
jgi:hypothetical protein